MPGQSAQWKACHHDVGLSSTNAIHLPKESVTYYTVSDERERERSVFNVASDLQYPSWLIQVPLSQTNHTPQLWKHTQLERIVNHDIIDILQR